MTMLSDEELAEALDAVKNDVDATSSEHGWAHDVELRAIRAHIDALTAQRDRARDIAVSLEQELAEVQRLAKTVDGLRGVFGVKA